MRGCHAVSSVHARRPEGNSWFARVPFSNLCRIVHEARMIIYSGPCSTILHLCLEAQTGTPRSDGSTNCLHLCLEMLNGSTNCLRGSPFVPEQRAFYNLLSGLTVSSSQTSVPIFLVLQMPRLPQPGYWSPARVRHTISGKRLIQESKTLALHVVVSWGELDGLLYSLQFSKQYWMTMSSGSSTHSSALMAPSLGNVAAWLLCASTSTAQHQDWK